ncbi:MAG: protein kinase [Verrucomicrobia bacterium]|nr:protein kinase [Verrucomicrobiota bacterium]
MNTPNLAIETIFNAAKALPPESRAEYLDLACREDAALRHELERLLSAAEGADRFFDANPVGLTQLGNTVMDTTVREGPGTRIGRYKLLQQIGEGGMGVVYMAEQEEPVRRRVALKIIKLGMDSKQVVARFEAERQALAMMDHPNIARVLDGGTTESGRPYFVMELVQGVSIIEFCDKARLPAQERLDLFLQVCEAVQSAHQKGIIHRDLKPSNILVTQHQGKPMPKVIDFGIAKATNQKLTEKTLFTQHATMIGTPAYMSPEQAEMSSMDVDTRSDIYSLGVLLYELLTGSTPFPEKRLRSLGYGEMQRVIAEEEPERPSARLSTLDHEQKTVVAKNRGEDLAALNTRLQGDLDWIVMKCLEKDRTRRYETANGLATDLKRHLDNEPVVARPPSLAYRLNRTWRRNRLACSAGLAVVLALALGIVLSSIQARKANQARLAALQAGEEERKQRTAADEARKAEATLRERAEASERTARRWSYAAAMNLAQKALANDDLARARDLLDAQRPTTGKEDLRGWEWRFLRGQCRTDEEQTLLTGLPPLSALALSPDGRFLAYAKMDASVTLMDLSTQQIVLQTKGSRNLGSLFRWRMDFSPAEPLFAVHEALPDGTFRILLWNTQLRTVHRAIPSSKEFGALRFSPDGRHLMICDLSQGLHLREIAHGDKVISWPDVTIAHGFLFSPDGKEALAVCTRTDLSVLSLDPAAPRQRILHSAEEFVGTVAVTSDGSTIASSDIVLETDIILRDWKTGEARGRLEGHRAFIHHLAFSPDNQLLASAGADQTVRLWDWRAGRCLATLRGHTGEVWAVAFTPDGRHLLSASKDGSIRRWPVHSKSEGLPFRLFAGGLNYVCGFTADSRWVITRNSTNGSFQRWGVDSAALPQPLFNAGTNTTITELSPDRTRLLVGHLDGWVREWDWARGQVLHQHQFGTEPISGVGYLSGGKTWAVSRTNSLCVWNHQLERIEGEFPLGLPETYNHQGWATTPDGNLVAARIGTQLLLWDAARGQIVGSFETGQPLNTVTFSPDGRWVAATQFDPLGVAHVWSVPDLKSAGTFRHHLECHAAGFSHDNRRLITGSLGSEAVRLWDPATGMDLITLAAPISEVNRVEFSPDGKHLVASSQLSNSAIWTAPTWAELEAMEGGLKQKSP